LDYSLQARNLASGELEKVRFVGVGSTLIRGGDGTVQIFIENGAAYPLVVGLDLTGTGVTFPAGESMQVELPPGRTDLPVEVARADGSSHSLAARLAAGDSVLDEIGQSLRFFGLRTVLPWLIGAAVIVALGAFLIVRRILLRRRPARSATGADR
jgi:hypothetical protein